MKTKAPISSYSSTSSLRRILTVLRSCALTVFFISPFSFLPLQAQLDPNFEKSFEEFQKNINQEFTQFQDSMNKVFAKALEEQWEEFRVFAKIPVPVKPNPKTPPVADTMKLKPEAPLKIPVKEIERAMPAPIKEEEPLHKEQPKQEKKDFKFYKTIHLWDTDFRIPYDKALENLNLSNTLEKTISDFWLSLSRTDYQPVIEAIEDIKIKCGLNHYGVAILCHEYAKSVWANKPNETTTLFVFLLNQSSLDAKVVRTSIGLEPVLHSPQTVYSKSFIAIDSKKYYFLLTKTVPASTYTYKINFSEQITGIDFHVNKPVNISNAVVDKELLIKKLNKTVTLSYSQSVIAYYKNYPQVDADINANAAVSVPFKNSVIKQFNPLLAGKTEYEAVSLLLNFMQYGFEYKTDEEQYGHEKWNFCEENLFYPYNDCDDRAILFSYLVRELLHLDVVLVLFSDHLTTAVRFNTPVSGDYLTVDGQQYIICDPTYIGAAIGMNSPKYKNEEAEIVKTKKL